MTYNEIVEKMKISAPLSTQDVNGEQMCRLYEDRYLKYVDYEGCKYELNLVPLEPGEHHIYELIKAQDSFKAFTELVEVFIKNFKNVKRSFIIFDHREYEVVLELMESNE